MTQRKRVLFLFNHDAAHQAAHIAGIMAKLALDHPAIEAIAATGNPAIEAQVRKLVSREAAEAITFADLSLPSTYEALLVLPNTILPAKRLARLRTNEALFESVDMLVSTERTCLRVKSRLGDRAPLFVYVPHGSGDRNVAYHPDLARFDYHLLSGQKLVDEMVAHCIVREDQCRVIGYAKFDTVAEDAGANLFPENKPTILYNPHFDPRLSSWYDMGPKLLEALAGMGDRFNVVFAPHVMLWRKKLHISPEYRIARRRPDIPADIAGQDNVLIDTASPALFDMTYTTGADIYIGDVSSQVYEFLRNPKPCIFIDAAGDGKDAYPFWANGPVVRSVGEVVSALDDWEKLGSDYRAKQLELFRYTIDHDPSRSASERGAQAIAEILA